MVIALIMMVVIVALVLSVDWSIFSEIDVSLNLYSYLLHPSLLLLFPFLPSPFLDHYYYYYWLSLQR
jgi:hypothetical protein